ncbi:MAG TPA: hypothetical protein VHU22_04645 [Xanthobacteraceae bacterium]|jgi:hypothetical protein|nr:hypothetical protein [Xanthobacteraceae bacterium]
MIRRAMIVSAVLTLVLAIVSAKALAAGNAQAKTTQFSCTGVKIEPAGLAQAPMTAKFNLVSEDKIALNLGERDIKGTVTSDNQIALRFQTRDFAGEFFHYTNDLFLLYRSGHLAKLACTPAQ